MLFTSCQSGRIPPLSIGQVKARLQSRLARREMNAAKAAGPDCIPPWVFDEDLAPVSCGIFNIIQHNIFLFLKTKHSFPEGYYQISLISCVGKSI